MPVDDIFFARVPVRRARMPDVCVLQKKSLSLSEKFLGARNYSKWELGNFLRTPKFKRSVRNVTALGSLVCREGCSASSGTDASGTTTSVMLMLQGHVIAVRPCRALAFFRLALSSPPLALYSSRISFIQSCPRCLILLSFFLPPHQVPQLAHSAQDPA